MANTFTPLQGYLAGIFRSVGVTVSAATVHELVRNGDFETGDLTNWTSNCTGTGSTGDIARVTASKGYASMSYGLMLREAGNVSNTCQVTGSRYLDTALTASQASDYDVTLSAWVKPANTGQTGRLVLSLVNPTGTVLGSGSVDIVDHSGYKAGEWAYYSVRIDAVTRTTGIVWQIESNMVTGSTGTWYIDDVSCVVLDQCAGAYGNLAVDGDEWGVADVTTFASIANDGPFRRIHPTMRNESTINVDSFYVPADSPAKEMAASEKVFVVLSTRGGTKTADRWEFWARPMNVTWSTALDDVQKGPYTLRIDGKAGLADR